MGVTIHFDGRLKDQNAFAGLVRRVKELAAANTWLTETFENSDVTLLRVRDEKDWDYQGPSKGIVLYVHEDCDPIRFEFDRDFYVQEFVKTQFAGSSTHIQVVKLLREFAEFFENLNVNDEGEYWETSNETLLAENIQRCNEMIEEEAIENPTAQVKVKAPDGRWIDLLK
jgi:hypothetical protein